MNSPAMEAALAGEGEAGTVEGNWGQGRLSAVTGKRNPAIPDRNHAVWGGIEAHRNQTPASDSGFFGRCSSRPVWVGDDPVATRFRPGFDPCNPKPAPDFVFLIKLMIYLYFSN